MFVEVNKMESLSTELKSLLTDYYVHDNLYNLVSIIQPRGKFSIGRLQMTQFWNLYSRIMKEDPDSCWGLMERPTPYMPVLVDVDLKFKFEHWRGDGSIYEDALVVALVNVFQQALREVVRNWDENMNLCVVLEKAPYSDGQSDFVKNGVHLHFPSVFLSVVDQTIVLLPKVRALLEDNAHGVKDHFEAMLPQLHKETTTVQDLIDEAVYRNNWLLYGSRKQESMGAYTVSYLVDEKSSRVELDTLIGYPLFDSEDMPIPLRTVQDVEYNLPRILSIVPNKRRVQDVLRVFAHSIDPECKRYLPQVVYSSEPLDDEDVGEDGVADPKEVEEAGTLVQLLSVERADKRNDWIYIGWVLFNISRGSNAGFEIWKQFSQQSSQFNLTACIYEWKHMTRRNVSIGSLKHFAKKDNPQGYANYVTEQQRNKMRLEVKTSHVDLALSLFSKYSDEYVYTDSGWFRFRDHHWEEIENGFEMRTKISSELVDFFEGLMRANYLELANLSGDPDEKKLVEMRLNERNKTIKDVVIKLKDTRFKSNVFMECKEVFFHRLFEHKLDTNRYLIGFQNGVFDLEENVFRDGLPTDYICNRLKINYTIYDENHPKVLEVLSLFEKIFPDNQVRRYFFDIMSETFVGFNHRKQVYFWTGEGDNGKSITEMFFEQMFGPLAKKCNTSLITSKRPSAGSANAELSRCGGGTRMVFLEEPDPDEEIYTGFFKHLSGNDSIFARDLYQSGKSAREIQPMFKMFVICNKLPRIRQGDKATWNRIRVVPFEAKFTKTPPISVEEQYQQKIFPVDPTIASKIHTLVEPFAWFLLDHRLKPRVKEPPKVTEATNKYKQSNDYIYMFYTLNTRVHPTGSIHVSELYTTFRDWVKESFPMGISNMPALHDFQEYFDKTWEESVNGVWHGRKIEVVIKPKESERVAEASGI